ncbi:protein kinase [Streptomyces sp. NPDC001068]|uniref:serine/threonine-protein kinase n=1 Tax=Streptomyces sp. NPDC001068 TaxID=3364544 RepID=UPI0036B497CD
MGEVFAGRYELADPIGHGGVGAVWRAWDHRRKRYVAAKVLQQSDAHALLRFVREQALRIDHPHVLAPASWAADDDKVLFTMDLVAGGSLLHLVGDYGPLPPAFVCTLLDQLLSGLAAVHAEGVVHRDIKPANILLEASGTARPRLRLSDFGIAMRFGEARLTETNLVVGTPGYIAPEQLLGAEPDFTADLFAVGLVAVFLLEGAKPDAKALVQHFAEHGTPGAPKNIPDPLWQAVATLLQPDPEARFRTATGARKALAQAMELLPEPGADDELIEIFDQLGPLPTGFGPEGPLRAASGIDLRATPSATEPTQPTEPTGLTGPGVGESTASTAETPDPARADTTDTDAVSGTGPDAVSGTGPDPRSGMASGEGTDSGADAGAAGGGAPGHITAAPGTAPGTTPEGSPGMSDTGSFRLPLPQAPVPPTPYPQVSYPQAPDRAFPSYPPYASHQQPEPRSQPSSYSRLPPFPDAPAPHPHTGGTGTTDTATYTTHDPRPPEQAPPAAVRTHGRRRRRARRPGPPAKAVVPVLLLALACYAVGFWALTRI